MIVRYFMHQRHSSIAQLWMTAEGNAVTVRGERWNGEVAD
jgi:hypothetical protein